MKIYKTVKGYRSERGDYTLELKEGESIEISGDRKLIIYPRISNIVSIKCQETKNWDKNLTDRTNNVKLEYQEEV